MSDESKAREAVVTREESRRRIDRWIEETRDQPLAGLPSDWPLAVWEVLVDDDPDCRYWAAHQVHCPEPIVRRLATDPAGRIRSRTARKRNLPTGLFAVLAADPYEPVRRAIACNPKAPLSQVEALTRDPDPTVAEVAIRHLRQRLERESRRASEVPAP
jgi:hypothetical protein